MIAGEAVTLGVEDGVALEARLAVPPGARTGLAIAHPHPLYGGDMDNPVVVRVAEVASDLGLATIRFNFRGVGRSTGSHGGGEAERRDLAAAIAHLRAVLPPAARIVAAGYSFGAMVTAHVAATAPVDALALVAPPLGLGDHRRLPDWPDALPVGVVVGTADEYCPPPAVARLRAERPRARITVVDGANHFFFGKLHPLGEALGGWLGAAVGASGTRQPGGSGGAG